MKRDYKQYNKVNLIDEEHSCYICGCTYQTEHHHIFGGANREISDKLGLVVMLCPHCHRTSKDAVHMNKQTSLELKEMGQREFEKVNSHEQFMELFMRNYL